MRPSMIAQKDAGFVGKLTGWLLGCVHVDILANAAIELATNGHRIATLENDDLVKLGVES
jgi:hypothetical protein